MTEHETTQFVSRRVEIIIVSYHRNSQNKNIRNFVFVFVKNAFSFVSC